MESSDRIDRSTGLFPQQMLETLLAHEVNHSRRYRGPVSLLHIAIHYFTNPSPEVA
jgi:GGDEF domain-containing protein